MAGFERIDAAVLGRFVQTIFKQCGMDEVDSHLLSDSLVYADLRGVHSHGVLRVPEYVGKLLNGGVDPRGRPEVVKKSGGVLVVDGKNSMGQIGLHFAMERAIEAAQQVGVAAAAIRGSNHCGALGYFARQALEREMIGLATTNALPTMAPWGGIEKIVGINPLAVAIPAGREEPIIYDAAFSGSSHGKIRVHAQKGIPIPEDWALDAQGKPTTDPEAALDGLLQPIGGFKGVGLALIMGILSSLLSEAAYGLESGNMEEGARPGVDGHFALVLRVDAFTAPDRFKERVDEIVAQIHRVAKADGVERTYAPGEPEAERTREYRGDGIPLNAITLTDLRRTAEALEVDPDMFGDLHR